MLRSVANTASLAIYDPPERVPPAIRDSERRALTHAKESELGSKRGSAALVHFALRGKFPSLYQEAKRQMAKRRLNSELTLRKNLRELVGRVRPSNQPANSLGGISDEVVCELFEEFINRGLGHVARGYKAAYLQTECQLKSIKHLAKSHLLKDHFVLVSTHASARQWASSLLLFNRDALLNTIRHYRYEFQSRLMASLAGRYGEKQSFSAEEIADYVCQDPLPNDVIENDVVMAMLLGFGVENGKQYVAGEEFGAAPPSNDYQMAQAYLRDRNLPAIPGFVSRESDDNKDVRGGPV